MCIYHFVMVLARFFSFHPHIPGMCLWEIWLGYCGFFFFFQIRLYGGLRHTQANYCVEDEGADPRCASCSVSPLALLP